MPVLHGSFQAAFELGFQIIYDFAQGIFRLLQNTRWSGAKEAVS
jgi:hypothetical protein